MKPNHNPLRENRRFAKVHFGSNLSPELTASLRRISEEFGFSLSAGEIKLLNNSWYVTHMGLLRLARRKHCCGIHVETMESLCDSASGRYVLKATVYPSKTSSGFVGYGDADPTNVSALVRGAEMRIAETRAVNRALRKAYGIGICSIEELGSASRLVPSSPAPRKSPHSENKANHNGNGTGAKIRDHLCQIIRQHKLDPELVKAYAIDFCGTATLKEAARDQVESFVRQLSEAANKDRNALICRLNSYARPTQEATA